MKNICIVGCGSIGKAHAKNLSGKANLFFHSRSRSSAEQLNKAFNGRRVYSSFKEVVKSKQIDAVVLSSPPGAHAEQIIRALEAGKSVLVEKPMCTSRQEVRDIGAAVKRCKKAFLMVAENYYYKPSLARIKELLHEGRIGEIRSVLVRKRWTQKTSGWKSRCGALLEGGIHFIALISDIMGRPESVEAVFPAPKQEPERDSITRLHYKDGAVAELHYSWSAKSPTKGLFQHSRIIGSTGTITFESNGLYILLNSNGRRRIFLPDSLDIGGYRAMIADFLDCLRKKDKKPYSDFKKAKRDLEIVFQAYGE